MVILCDINCSQIITPLLILTHSATFHRIWIYQIRRPSEPLEVRRQVSATGLSARGVEDSEFGRLARNLLIPKRESEHSTHEIRKRVQIVHPETPKFLDLAIRDEDAAEGCQHGDDEGINQTCCDCIGSVGGDKLTDTRVDEFVYEHDKKYGTGLVAGRGEARSVVEADKVEHCTDNEVGEFADDETGYESLPRCVGEEVSGKVT